MNIISFDLLKDNFSVLNEYFKGIRIDHLVNNAGLLINKTIDKLSVDEFRMQYEVNVIAVFSLVKSLLNSFVKGSTICNITSMGGINGSSKFPGLLGYSSSKGALSILRNV